MERAMMERLVTGIHVRELKVNAMESKTRHYVIMPGKVFWKFNIEIKKAK